MIEFTIKPKSEHESINQRIDKFLCQEFDISFAVAQKLIRNKKIIVNQKTIDYSYKISIHDHILIKENLPTRHKKFTQKTASKNSIEKLAKQLITWKIFEDEKIIIINKPSGIPVQGGSGINLSINDALNIINQKTSKNLEKWQLVHRLDKDTSGLLLIAKNSKIADFLTSSFKNKDIKKTYLALVKGRINKDKGIIDIPLRKKMLNKNEKVYPDIENGKSAITHFKLIKNFSNFSLIELKPITGRTHQLRVHCKEIGNPIINDIKYGGKEVINRKISARMCLHSQYIAIEKYYEDGSSLEIKDNSTPDFLKNI